MSWGISSDDYICDNFQIWKKSQTREILFFVIGYLPFMFVNSWIQLAIERIAASGSPCLSSYVSQTLMSWDISSDDYICDNFQIWKKSQTREILFFVIGYLPFMFVNSWIQLAIERIAASGSPCLSSYVSQTLMSWDISSDDYICDNFQIWKKSQTWEILFSVIGYLP
jgi:uncharacterized membrane protein YqaE (UPF0057 family)